MGKYRKLIIVGNGFDRWQKLPTSYGDFKNYYSDNILDVAKSLKIKVQLNENREPITPVELIFGNIINPSALSDDFFWNFENSTALIDDQEIINYFNKTEKGVRRIRKLVKDAKKILTKLFVDWIRTINVDNKDAGYTFGDDCFFISFNYTDTLESRFGIPSERVYHIHGKATNPKSIIFGHSTHPEKAFSELFEQRFITCLNGKKSLRLQGLYFVEDALYETDKHVQDNIDKLCMYMALNDIHIEDFTDVFILGHSFSETDFEYLYFLSKVTKCGCDYNKLSALEMVRNIGLENLDEDQILKNLQLNVAYATQHRKYILHKGNLSFPKAEAIELMAFGDIDIHTDENGEVYKNDEKYYQECKDAVKKRFITEQALRTKRSINKLFNIKNIRQVQTNCNSILSAADYIDGGHQKRQQDAKWHISYFSDDDKKQIESVMRRLDCDNYELHNSIDECILEFKF